MKYLTVEQVLKIHTRQMELFGGSTGIRDMGLLESAVAQPRSGIVEISFYPTLEEIATALAFSLVKNHPFVDGNKRTGYAAMEMFLGRNGYKTDAPLEEKEAVFLRLAASQLSREGLLAWVRTRIARK